MRRVRVFAVAMVTTALVGIAGCGDADDAAPTRQAEASAGRGLPAALTTVTLSDNKFSPIALQVPVGTTVTWKWTGKANHSVQGSFDEKAIASPVLSGAGTFAFAFQKAGIFHYECGIHGAAMKGTVTIQ